MMRPRALAVATYSLASTSTAARALALVGSPAVQPESLGTSAMKAWSAWLE